MRLLFFTGFLLLLVTGTGCSWFGSDDQETERQALDMLAAQKQELTLQVQELQTLQDQITELDGTLEKLKLDLATKQALFADQSGECQYTEAEIQRTRNRLARVLDTLGSLHEDHRENTNRRLGMPVYDRGSKEFSAPETENWVLIFDSTPMPEWDKKVNLNTAELYGAARCRAIFVLLGYDSFGKLQITNASKLMSDLLPNAGVHTFPIDFYASVGRFWGVIVNRESQLSSSPKGSGSFRELRLDQSTCALLEDLAVATERQEQTKIDEFRNKLDAELEIKRWDRLVPNAAEGRGFSISLIGEEY